MKYQTQLKLILFIGIGILSSNAFAQSVERIYAGNSCNADQYGEQGPSNSGTWDLNSDQSLDAGSAGTDGEYDIVCPIVRQKVGSAAGAKFFAYADDMGSTATREFECTMTSRRPHNGALVSTGTRLRTGAQANSNGEVTLARSIAPSSTFGAYNLTCKTNNGNPRIHSYRIKEF